MSSVEVINPEKTMGILWERVTQQGDLPGFTCAINAILSAVRGEDEDDQEFNMTQTVLSDPALTQKVLRLANSPMYGAFGQSIATVSKAVIVLGTETIGHLALGLKLIDELAAASPDTSSTYLEMEKAVLAGNVARRVACSANYRDTEEAVVCSMLHTLGRMMVVFYLPDRWSLIQECLQRQNHKEDENTTASQFLGLSLEELGRATAKKWGLPKDLIDSMRELPPCKEALAKHEWMAGLSTMSCRCATAICQDEEVGNAAIVELANHYAAMLGVSADAVIGAVAHVKQNADSIAVQLAKRTHSANHARETQLAALPERRLALHEILHRGISDMRDAQKTAAPSQMIAMALETLYKGLDLKRAITFLYHHKTAQYVAKMGFGMGVQSLLPHLVIDDTDHADVFKMALLNDKPIFIEHAQETDLVPKLPHWWKSLLMPCQSFLILPLSLNKQPTAFVYGDWGDQAPTMSLQAREFALLHEIRALLIHSLERRRQATLRTPAGAIINRLKS